MDEQAKKTALRMIPYGLYVLGTKDGDRVTASTINWLTQVSFKPPLIAMGIKTDTEGFQHLKNAGDFALSILGAGQKDMAFAFVQHAPLPDQNRMKFDVIYEEGVKVFVAGLAVPGEFIDEMHERDIKVIVMCGKVRHAQKSEAAGADVVAAQGTEAGGHTGEIGTLALVPQVVDAVKIPVVAAGGIVDGRGVVAALALGAQGAVIGTRFIATPEATAARQYREALVRAQQDETIRTRTYSGKQIGRAAC